MTVARASLPGDRTSVSAARRFVADRLGVSAGRPGYDEALLLTSELVTNAVVHAGTPLEVTCLVTQDTVEVGVEDEHPAKALPDAPPRGPEDGVTGRGLVLVAAIADAWGVTYNRVRKRVWFQLGAASGRSMVPVRPAPGGPRYEGLLNEVLTSGVKEDELLDRTVRVLREIAGGDAACLLLNGETPHEPTGEPAWLYRAASVGEIDIPERVSADDPGIRAGSLVTAPLRAGGEVAGLAVVAAEEPGRFDEDEVGERLRYAADRIAITLERVRLAEAERSRRGWLAFLAEASDLLAGILDENLVAALTAQLVVPRIAMWCAVYLGDDLVHAWHADERKNDVLRVVLEEGGRPEDGHMETFPLTLAGDRLGTLVLGARRVSGEINRLMEDLARRVALALGAARQYRQQALTSDALQRSLLPAKIPEIPGVDSAVVYEARGDGNVVGGDFYDIVAAGTGRWAFMIGDVCGSGPEAAAVTGFARHAVRLLAQEGHGAAAILERLNHSITDEDAPNRFLSLIYGEIVPTGEGGANCVIASAGHPLPLRLRPNGCVEPVASPQLLLGILDEVGFTTETLALDPGDVLLCVTDGVTERRSGRRLFDDDGGLAELLATCTGLTAQGVADRIRRAVHDFGPGPAPDDMAMLVLRAIPPHDHRET